MKQIVMTGIVLLGFPFLVHATPFLNYSLVIDKPDYSTRYSVGVDVNALDAEVGSILVHHQSNDSNVFQPWYLSKIGPGEWWSWSPLPGVSQSSGPLEGNLTIEAMDRDENVVSRGSFRFKPEEELDFPVVSVSKDTEGYKVQTAAVTNADFYLLHIWDPIQEFYPVDLRLMHVSDIPDIPYAGLVEGRDYSLYLHAYNEFSGGIPNRGNHAKFRAYTKYEFTHSVATVPEPSTMALFGLCFLVLWCRLRLVTSLCNPPISNQV